MPHDFPPVTWDDALADDCRQLVRLAVREDLGRAHDWTTLALVDHEAEAGAVVVARQGGVVAGLPAAALVLEEIAPRVTWTPSVEEGSAVAAGQALARVAGPARDLLTSERIVLNFLGRLCGVATLAARFVEAVEGTGARIYDTRKTTPGWRRLEKYAARCGGASNHRLGLSTAVLIKDNHLALGAGGADRFTPGEAVRRARKFLAEADAPPGMPVEVEVDTLEQLDDALGAAPDIVLLDNMPPTLLREAVARRNTAAPDVQLEASGGVRLDTVRRIASTGVDRISVGALTHSAVALDVGLDWGE